jgi:hypothetical protein
MSETLAVILFFGLCAGLFFMSLTEDVEVIICSNDRGEMTYFERKSTSIPEALKPYIGKCEEKLMSGADLNKTLLLLKRGRLRLSK